MKNELGFSLVETICCTVIVSLLSVISGPAFLSLRADIELKAMVHDMMADLQLAKFEAVKENNHVIIALTQSGYKVFVDNGAGGGYPGDWQWQTEERLIVERDHKKIATITSSFPNDKIRYKGVLGMTPGTIYITGKNNVHYNVVITRAGRIRIEKAS